MGDMEVMSSDFDRQQVVVEATANAAAYNITHEAQADAQFMWNQAGGEALGAIQQAMAASAMSLTNFQLLNYLEKTALIDEPQGPLVYGDLALSATLHAKDEL